MLTDEMLSIVNESLKQNRVLLQLGMQSTELTCEGIITLAEIMETNQVLQVKFSLKLDDSLLYFISFLFLQRIDLRDNSIQMHGMHALVNVMKKNKTITQIDLDDKPRLRIVSVDTCFCLHIFCNTKSRSYVFLSFVYRVIFMSRT